MNDLDLFNYFSYDWDTSLFAMIGVFFTVGLANLFVLRVGEGCKEFLLAVTGLLGFLSKIYIPYLILTFFLRVLFFFL
jgi:hypothetical protein